MCNSLKIQCVNCNGTGIEKINGKFHTCTCCEGKGFTIIEYEEFRGIKINKVAKEVDGLPYIKWLAIRAQKEGMF